MVVVVVGGDVSGGGDGGDGDDGDDGQFYDEILLPISLVGSK